MMELSRRKLLVAAGAAAAVVPAAHAAQDPSLSDNVPKKWDRTVKLLIVGAGGAGLTAAVPLRRTVSQTRSFLKRWLISAAIRPFLAVV